MEYNLKLTDQDLQVLSGALSEMPFKMVAGLITKINLQIKEQTEKKES